MTNSCSLSRWTETYLDGELSPEHTVDFENHLPTCCVCNTKLKFERAVRISTKRVVRSNINICAGFESRLRALMAEELLRERESAEPSRPSSASTPGAITGTASAPVVPFKSEAQHRPLSWRSIAPLSVAAAAALAFAAMRGEPQGQSGNVLAGASVGEIGRTDTMQTVREFLDQLAADSEHSPSTDAPSLPQHLPFSLPVATDGINVIHGQRITPPRLENAGAIWEGYHYRQVPVQGRVSSWHYRVANHRVLLWVYDSKKLPLRAILEPHIANNQPVFVGTHHGRAIAALERNGTGYAATTDLPQAKAAELVAALGNTVVR